MNRIWGYLMGRGIIEPLDDIRAGNPPTNPELLDYLTSEFIQSGFNVRHVMELICKSRTYQLSVETNQWNEDDQINFSHARARRLPAEVLFDAIYRATGATSAIPGVAAGSPRRHAARCRASSCPTDSWATWAGRRAKVPASASGAATCSLGPSWRS